mmetsp:Transcript_2148/g.3629  ORF Transcript_2148/g.3629 Transcript_2148/m.3629 type:complete len:120 (-) Transcript_2148:243-602(-)
MAVAYIRTERKIGRTGPNMVLNPAHPTPAIAFMSNCKAQQELDKRGKSTRRIDRDNDENLTAAAAPGSLWPLWQPPMVASDGNKAPPKPSQSVSMYLMKKRMVVLNNKFLPKEGDQIKW